MRTVDARRIRKALDSCLQELPARDQAEALHLLRPVLERVRAGEWRIELSGPRTATELDAAALFEAQLIELADAIERRP
jgi:hypothetical protein